MSIEVNTLLVTITILIAAVCVGLWWYLKFKVTKKERRESRESMGSLSGAGSSELVKVRSEPEISQAVESALATDHIAPLVSEPSVEVIDKKEPAESAIPDFMSLNFEEETFALDSADQERMGQPDVCDSSLQTEDILNRIETSPQDDRPSEAQVESEFFKANHDRDAGPDQDRSVHLASESVVPPLVPHLATASTDPINRFTANAGTAEQIGEPAVIRTELAESSPSVEASPDEKSNQGAFVLDEPSANERETLQLSQEVAANDIERAIPIELADIAGQDIAPIANEQMRPVPAYRPLAPAAATVPQRARRSTVAASSPSTVADLRLRLQLSFGRGGDVTLKLVADRREHMPDELEVSFERGKLFLIRHRKDRYEPVNLSEASSALHDGVEWRGGNDSYRYRWMLSRRELHVLAEGDVSGLYPFGSMARLQLNARHVVLATKSLRARVLVALSEVGCDGLEGYDETTPGVPAGWILFRNVIPTNAAPMRDGADLLNALCPLPDLELHFVGGIHLERDTWLLGHPPHIRLTGDLSGVEIKLDGKPVIVGNDGNASAPDWDVEGDHRLWFGGQTKIYTLKTIDENWQRWPAIDFRMGATICGASVESSYGSRHLNQVRVPTTNPLLIGARPGEVFHFHRPDNVQAQTFVACTPFEPVWALPSDPAHANRATARILLLRSAEPFLPAGMRHVKYLRSKPELQTWFSMINAASKKRLQIEPCNEAATALWLRYRALAKQLRRSAR